MLDQQERTAQTGRILRAAGRFQQFAIVPRLRLLAHLPDLLDRFIELKCESEIMRNY